MNRIEIFKQKYFSISVKNILLFLFIWLMTGFSLGTITLLAPVRWVVNLAKSLNASESVESLLIKFIIILLLLISFYTSLRITKLVLRKNSLKLTITTLLVLLMFTSGFTWFWMNPSMMQTDKVITSEEKFKNAEFIFGSYPTPSDFRDLKSDGFTAVISLLHPAVVPFEPVLLAEEKEAAASTGLKLIHIPMLPWVSDNKASIEEIKRIAQKGTGKYYVHCYLGKDRVNVVKRIIHTFSSSMTTLDIDSTRILNEQVQFERGKIIRLDDDLYLSPFPTDDEFIRHVLNGSIKKVVSLLNPNHPPDTMWINREERILKGHMMPYELLPIDMNSSTEESLKRIVQKIKKMRRPLLVHAFLQNSPQTKAFVESYNKTK